MSGGHGCPQRTSGRDGTGNPAPRATPTAVPRPAFEQAATAVAAALLPQNGNGDVTIRPIAQKPSLFMEPAMAEPTQQEIVYSDPRIATIAPVDAEVIAGQIVLHLFKRLTDGKQA